MIRRRRFCGWAAGLPAMASPVVQAASFPAPVRPVIQRRVETLLIGYFGDSTSRGAWATYQPGPNFYAYDDLTVPMKAALSDLGPVEVLRKGNDGESALTLLNGAYIPNAQATVDPFSARLAEQPYDAVVVCVGIVDALFGRSPEQFGSLLAGLHSAAQAAAVPLYFETPNPVPKATFAALLESYRPVFARYDHVIDQNYSMDMSDEFHPTSAAYVVKVNRVAEALRQGIVRRYVTIQL